MPATRMIQPCIQRIPRPMTCIPKIVTDPYRFAALDSYNVLDTAAEAGFDDVVLLAREICDTPIALISLVASKRQWFKATSGTELCETPIEQSVCAHALAQSDTLVIPDLTNDDRTRTNALVTGEPHIRFYAGALLKTPEGVPIGTVCVIDLKPRLEGLSAEQIKGLEALARQAMLLLELRKAVASTEDAVARSREDNVSFERRQAVSERFIARLRDSERRLRMAQEAGQVGTFEIDIQTNRVRASEQFCRIFGLPFNPFLDSTEIENLVVPDDSHIVSHADGRAQGQIPLAVEYRIARADDRRVVWVSRRAEFVKDDDGRPVRMLGTVQDVTERKKADEAQALLNDEISHRLKNTLSMVQAIAMQTLRSATDKEAVRAFGQRVAALGRAHEALLQTRWTGADLQALLTKVLQLHAGADRFLLKGPDIQVGAKAALSLSLLIHELATNALKYGSLSAPAGGVAVAWKVDGRDLMLSWTESGGPPAAEPAKTGFGSRLIQMGLVGTGQVERRYLPLGLSAEFRAPLSLIEET
jgi:PAS domain S-box-containing protein